MNAKERAEKLLELWDGDWADRDRETDVRIEIEAAIQEERLACADLARQTFEQGRFFEGVRSGGDEIYTAILARGTK